jgi:methyl-accepting chemotaxis protein
MTMWTFGKKIGASFALALGLLALIGAIAFHGAATLARTSYAVTRAHQVLEHIEALFGELRDAETGQRGFVITGDESYLEPYTSALSTMDGTLRELRELTADSPAQLRRLDAIAPLIESKRAELKAAIDLRRTSGFEAAAARVSRNEGKRYMDELRRHFDSIEADEREILRLRADDVERVAGEVNATVLYGTILSALFVSFVGLALARSLATQIGSAVKNVHTSSSELQAAASQQVTSSKEQATAMAEISTTINELLATSRQIASSSQRVAQMASQTAGSARSGDRTVQRTQDELGAMRRQVEGIVAHMIELGGKSQQIGGVLDVLNELAEQTNILAINATIEAFGAGESGRRFGVVADEIRKLADRASGSMKDVRRMVEDVRAAVNTTIMATEAGSKAVDAGTRQFGEVASAFAQIVSLVGTTTEAAREIELSTKQQATAVEQVNTAIANVSQTTRETETSSSQTLATSAQLTSLAHELSRLVRPGAA